MQEGDELVRQIKAEMSSMQSRHDAMVSSLQEKLKWYADNQDLLTANDALVSQQAEVIRKLEEQLAVAGGPSARAAQARIRELEEQVRGWR